MELEQLTELIKAVSKSDCDLFCFEEGNLKIKIKKGRKASIVSEERPAAAPCARPEAEEEDRFIRAPLVGTFYSAAKEGEKPLVEVGDTIHKGQVIGIVEAMKLMNDVESDLDGTVAEILIKDKSMVEYGQPLFRVV